MPSQHYVSRFAQTLQASPVVQANALRALAITGEGNVENENEWAPLAAAALIVGAKWAGEDWVEQDVARATGVPEYELVRQLANLSEQLENSENTW